MAIGLVFKKNQCHNLLCGVVCAKKSGAIFVSTSDCHFAVSRKKSSIALKM